MSVNFFSESVSFDLEKKHLIKEWIKKLISEKKRKVGDICIVFSSDENVIEINRKYLNHDYYTDVITFNYNVGNSISGDIFISIDTVRQNSIRFNVSFEYELYRVIIHGILHLLGFDDTTEELRAMMRMKEDEALDLLYAKFFTKSR